MSRRHHGGRPHRFNGPSRPIDSSRPVPPPPGRPDAPPGAGAGPESRQDTRATIAPVSRDERPWTASSAPIAAAAGAAPDGRPLDAPAAIVVELTQPADPATSDGAVGPIVPADPSAPAITPAGGPSIDGSPAPAIGSRPANGQGYGVGVPCTAPQLRRFIKSRPYVPMHELRRRFGINGSEDDVTSVELAGGRVYVGLPSREGSLLGELLRGGEVGYELSLDPRSPVVVGLYPMRPVARG